MNCRDVRSHWSLYHDSEGEAPLYARINEHLADCRDCARWYERQNRIERSIEDQLAPAPPDDLLWRRVLEQAEVTKRERSRPPANLFALLATAAVGVLLAAGLWWGVIENQTPLAEAATDYHMRLTNGREALDLSSESDLEVEAYLRDRVSFPVRCPPRSDSGFHVAGAGVRRIDEIQAAYLVGTVEDDPVSIFIFPRDALTRFPGRSLEIVDDMRQSRHAGFELMLREFDQNLIVVVGRSEPRRLRRVLSAYGSYPHSHG